MDSTGPFGFLRSWLPGTQLQAPPEVAASNRALALREAALQCTACGFCDLLFDAYDRTDHPEFRGPMPLVLGFARVNNIAGMGAQVRELKKGNLEQLEAHCPARVPFSALAASLEEQAGDDLRQRQTERPRKRHDPG